MTASVARRRLDAPTLLAIVIALVAGLGVASLDSRPGWDDTGITAGLLIVGAALAAAVSGRSPWLWAILVGIWIPAIEIPASGATASLVALVFAAIGAALGFALRRAVRPG